MRGIGECVLLVCPRCQQRQTGEALPTYWWVGPYHVVQLRVGMRDCVGCGAFGWSGVHALIFACEEAS